MGTNSLYYIMDYSGNYYRTNQADQLVTAAGVQEAQIFTFAQANRRIGAGKKAAFYCMIPMENEAAQEEKHNQVVEQEGKEKEKELDCLYALTDTIDCPSLAGVYEESLAEIEDIMDVQSANDSTDIFEADTEQEEIHVVKNINEMAG